MWYTGEAKRKAILIPFSISRSSCGIAIHVLDFLSSSPLARVFPTRTISASHDAVVTLSRVLRYEITFIEELTRLKRLHRYWISLKCDKRKFANCFGTSFMWNSLWQFSIQVYDWLWDRIVNRIFVIIFARYRSLNCSYSLCNLFLSFRWKQLFLYFMSNCISCMNF